MSCARIADASTRDVTPAWAACVATLPPLLSLLLLLLGGAAGTSPVPAVARGPTNSALGDLPDAFVLVDGDATTSMPPVTTTIRAFGLGRAARPDADPGAVVLAGYTWAPEVVRLGSNVLLYYTARHRRTHRPCIGVAGSGMTTQVQPTAWASPPATAPLARAGACRPQPLLRSRGDSTPPLFGPGHQALFQTGTTTWMAYHGWGMTTDGRRGASRFLHIDRVDWSADGTSVVRGPPLLP